MNIKHLFFYMLLIAFSSCSKPGYEKAIAEWVQTDNPLVDTQNAV